MDIAEKKEHVLVCLSPSLTNEKLILSASKMAQAFQGQFTALYIKSIHEMMSHEDEIRLQQHISLARKSGAEIATITGEDIPLLISEYASVAGVTKIVIGRSGQSRKLFFPGQKITERLIQLTSDIDIYIMPDQNKPEVYQKNHLVLSQQILPSVSDIVIMCSILCLTTILGLCFQKFGFTEANIITVYILGVLIASITTDTYAIGVIMSVGSVILFNFFFTEPRMTLHAYGAGYPVTFGIMLIASVITGSLAGKLNQDAKLLASDAFRTKVLLDTDKLLEQAEGKEQIIQIAGKQLCQLLQRSVIVVHSMNQTVATQYLYDTNTNHPYTLNEHEKELISWVYKNHKRAGATTDIFSSDNRLYLAIRINEMVYGVVGIDVAQRDFNSHENSIVFSILGECALALDNERIRKEKDEAALIAKNEKLRSNLLRTISHDLRTPLTSISGDASILLDRYDELDDTTRKQMFTDIYDDSEWLYNVVENLLSVTRFEEGKMNLHFSDQVVDDLVDESLKHIDRKRNEHHIRVKENDALLLVKVDARLIMQVIINIVNNAIKYTQAGSTITIQTSKMDSYVKIQILDDGPGMSETMKKHVFEMFYTGEKSADYSGRSLGLGLALCKSIVESHGGNLNVEDNIPHGCIFSFTLPLSEVKINEM